MSTAIAAPPEDDLFAFIDTMTVLELLAFVKQFEERFDVVAQAPAVAPVVVVAEEIAAPVEEQTEFKVLLMEIGPTKIPVIRGVREVTSLGLKESKDLVDAFPVVIKEGISKSDAEKVKTLLEDLGATVEIK